MKIFPTKDGRLARLMKICQPLPEAMMEPASRHATFQVRGKTFAYYLNDRLGDGIVAVCCKVAPGENVSRIARHPSRFYLPEGIGEQDWVAMRLDTSGLDWKDAAELVVGSYKLVAPNRLALLAKVVPVGAEPRSGPRPGIAPRKTVGPRQREGVPAKGGSGAKRPVGKRVDGKRPDGKRPEGKRPGTARGAGARAARPAAPAEE